MSNYPNTTTIDLGSSLFPKHFTSIHWKETESERESIIKIDDIKDITIPNTEKLYAGAATAGASITLSPSAPLSKQTVISLAISTVLAAFVSTWINAYFFLTLFLGLGIINLITSVIFDANISFKKKIQTFGMDLFYVGVLMTITDILLNKIKIPFLDTQSFYIGTFAFLMSINYIILTSKRCYHLTSLSGSTTLVNLAKSFKFAKDKFIELQEKDATK